MHAVAFGSTDFRGKFSTLNEMYTMQLLSNTVTIYLWWFTSVPYIELVDAQILNLSEDMVVV